MKQIAAIFMKDARRFWPEILICLALLVAFVFIYPVTWRLAGGYGAMGPGRWIIGKSITALLAATLVVLIPIGWLVLIARVIHCEPVVGNTQFWITRPYDWRKLFAAKLVYLAAFLYTPFFAAQCILLREAGLHPFEHLGGVLYNLLLLTIVGVLPLIALSSLATGLGRLMVIVLAVILAIIAAAAIASSVSASGISSVPDLLSGNVALGLILCGSLSVAVVMYARRSAKVGWIVLVAMAMVIGTTAFFDPDRALIDRYYPSLSSGSAAPVTFAYGAKNLDQPPANLSIDDRSIDIGIPITALGIQDGSVIIPQALKVTITGAGATWNSVWQGVLAEHFLPDDSGALLNFRIPRSVYEQFSSSAVTLHLSLAITVARHTSDSVVYGPTSDFAVPEIGVCKPVHSLWVPDQIEGITCRSAMNQPQLTLVSSRWKFGNCKGDSGDTPMQMPATAWVGELDPDHAEFGITSVWEVPVPLSPPSIDGNSGKREWQLCTDTPIVFTQYRPSKRLRQDVTIANFHLPELAIGDQVVFRGEN